MCTCHFEVFPYRKVPWTVKAECLSGAAKEEKGTFGALNFAKIQLNILFVVDGFRDVLQFTRRDKTI